MRSLSSKNLVSTTRLPLKEREEGGSFISGDFLLMASQSRADKVGKMGEETKNRPAY